MHTREGLAVAKTRGRLKGKQPKLTAARNTPRPAARHAVRLREAGEIVDVTISYPLSLENQMLGWSRP